MSETRIAKMADKLESYAGKIKKLKEEGQEVAGRVIHSTLTVAGGAAVGATRAWFGDKHKNYAVKLPGTEIDAELAVGLALTGAAVTGVAGKYSDHLNSLGSGMLAVLAAEQTKDAIIKASEKHK